MAWGNPATRGTQNLNGVSSGTIARAPSSNTTVGNVLFCMVTFDNISTTDGDTSTVSGVADAKSNTWVKVCEFTNTEAGADADGSANALWYTFVTTQITTSDAVTATFTSNRSRGTIHLWECTKDAGTTSLTASVYSGADRATTSATPSYTLSGLSNIERLYILCRSQEATGVAGSVTNYTSINSQADSSGTNATSQSGQALYRILTGTGDTATGSGFGAGTDKAFNYVAFAEVAGGGAGDTIVDADAFMLIFDFGSSLASTNDDPSASGAGANGGGLTDITSITPLTNTEL